MGFAQDLAWASTWEKVGLFLVLDAVTPVHKCKWSLNLPTEVFRDHYDFQLVCACGHTLSVEVKALRGGNLRTAVLEETASIGYLPGWRAMARQCPNPVLVLINATAPGGPRAYIHKARHMDTYVQARKDTAFPAGDSGTIVKVPWGLPESLFWEGAVPSALVTLAQSLDWDSVLDALAQARKALGRA